MNNSHRRLVTYRGDIHRKESNDDKAEEPYHQREPESQRILLSKIAILV